MNHAEHVDYPERRRNRIIPEPRLAIVAGPFLDKRLGAETAACAARVGLVPVVLPPSRLVIDPRDRARTVCTIIDGEAPAARLCSTICSLILPGTRIIFLLSAGSRPPEYMLERGDCVAKPLTPFALRELLL